MFGRPGDKLYRFIIKQRRSRQKKIPIIKEQRVSNEGTKKTIFSSFIGLRVFTCILFLMFLRCALSVDQVPPTNSILLNRSFCAHDLSTTSHYYAATVLGKRTFGGPLYLLPFNLRRIAIHYIVRTKVFAGAWLNLFNL